MPYIDRNVVYKAFIFLRNYLSKLNLHSPKANVIAEKLFSNSDKYSITNYLASFDTLSVYKIFTEL